MCQSETYCPTFDTELANYLFSTSFVVAMAQRPHCGLYFSKPHQFAKETLDCSLLVSVCKLVFVYSVASSVPPDKPNRKSRVI